MAGKYQAYPEYKDSGIQWLGEVPVSWEGIRLKWVFSEKTKTANTALPAGSISFGSVIFKNEENLSPDTKASYQEVLAGEFLINPLNMNFDLKSLRTALSDVDVVVSTGYIVLNCLDSLNKRYVRWLLQEFDVAHMKTLGSGVRQTIGFTDIGNCFAFFPSSTEQDQIANFLDHETAKIDTLIEEQQSLIRLLKEKRQAVISHAVTKGLNPDAPMKDSGLEWLGEVPEHWEPMQLRRVIKTMEQGKSPECENREAEVGEWGVLKTSCVNRGVFNFKANKALPEHIQPFAQYEVKLGDILMSRASGSIDLIGSVAYVTETQHRILLSDKIFRLHLNSSIDRAYFAFLMQSSYMRKNVEQAISGAEGMANNITKGAVMGFIFALPPQNEQTNIVEHIRKQVTLIDKLIAKANTFVNISRERRTALISAAVTGKIDVRNWVAPATATESTASHSGTSTIPVSRQEQAVEDM